MIDRADEVLRETASITGQPRPQSSAGRAVNRRSGPGLAEIGARIDHHLITPDADFGQAFQPFLEEADRWAVIPPGRPLHPSAGLRLNHGASGPHPPGFRRDPISSQVAAATDVVDDRRARFQAAAATAGL